MAKEENLSGVDTSKEDVYSELKKDLTPTPVKIKRYLSSEGAWIFLVSLLLVVLFIPALNPLLELTLIITYFIFLGNVNAKELAPFKKRKSSFSKIDENQLNPANNKPMAPDGITFFGNEKGTRKEVWFTNSDVRTHCLIFGTTGAGKTETMLSICVNSLNQHSGFIYIDGKGDNELWAKIFSLAASRGRLDDLYIINFMTSHMNSYKKTSEKSSHTMNPCATANQSTLSELFISLMPESSGDGVWQGRAGIYISALLNPLVYLRDHGKLLLDVDVIRKHFQYDKTEELAYRSDIPLKYRDGLIQYIQSLAGYISPTPDKPNVKQPESVYEQHGYINMQFTDTFGLLADSYGHIMKTQIAEVDFYDIVINRRILVVLLPALEKSKQSLGNLGKIIVASIKNMMSTTLGSKVVGSRKDTIDMKATKSDSPFMTIFDEYGYYSVKGAAVMPAQARSLGFFMIFAGQDYQAFKAGSEDDVGSIIANCKIKICMALEDPKETLEIFKGAAGQGKTAEISNFEKDTKAMSEKYGASKNVSISARDIIDVKDLRKQNEGESHMLFKDETRRLKHFYAEPKLLDYMDLNTFLEVESLDYNVAKNFYNGEKSIFKRFLEILDNFETYKNQIRRSLNAIISAKEEVEVIFKFLKKAEPIKDEQIKAAFALAAYVERVEIINEKIVTEVRDNLKKYNDYYDDEEDDADDKDMTDSELDFNANYDDEDEDDIDDILGIPKGEEPPVKPNLPNNRDKDRTKDKTNDRVPPRVEPKPKEVAKKPELKNTKKNPVSSGSSLFDRIQERIKSKKGILDTDDDFGKDLFDALELDYLDIKSKLNDMEYNLNNKLYLTGLSKNKEKNQKDTANALTEDTLLDLTMSAKPKKQKQTSQAEIDKLIGELIGDDLGDI